MTRRHLRTLPAVPVLWSLAHLLTRRPRTLRPLRSLVSAIDPRHGRRTRGLIPSFLRPRSSPAHSRIRLYFPIKWRPGRRSRFSTSSSILDIGHGRVQVIFHLWSRASRAGVIIRASPRPRSRLFRWVLSQPLVLSQINHLADSHHLLDHDPRSLPKRGTSRLWASARTQPTYNHCHHHPCDEISHRPRARVGQRHPDHPLFLHRNPHPLRSRMILPSRG